MNEISLKIIISHQPQKGYPRYDWMASILDGDSYKMRVGRPTKEEALKEVIDYLRHKI